MKEKIVEVIKYSCAVQSLLLSHESDKEFIKKVFNDIDNLADKIVEGVEESIEICSCCKGHKICYGNQKSWECNECKGKGWVSK